MRWIREGSHKWGIRFSFKLRMGVKLSTPFSLGKPGPFHVATLKREGSSVVVKAARFSSNKCTVGELMAEAAAKLGLGNLPQCDLQLFLLAPSCPSARLPTADECQSAMVSNSLVFPSVQLWQADALPRGRWYTLREFLAASATLVALFFHFSTTSLCLQVLRSRSLLRPLPLVSLHSCRRWPQTRHRRCTGFAVRVVKSSRNIESFLVVPGRRLH